MEKTTTGWYDNLGPDWYDRMHDEATIGALRSGPPLSIETIEKLRPQRSPEQIERMYAARNRRLAEIAAEDEAKKTEGKKDE